MITLPEKPKIISKEGNSATIEISGTYPGYGITLSNAIRRVLFSSLPGVAITSVRIKGVNHEFSTIPHIYENVLDIILNLKQIRFKLFGEGPIELSLKAKGERRLTAKDFSRSSDIEIITPDTHIATLTDKNAEIDMMAVVSRGLGFEMSERRAQDELPIGTIAVDAIFTPIKKVNIKVEDMRVGERTDYNRIILDIETDGTISPESAFFEATKILANHFQHLSEAEKEPKQKEVQDVSKIKIGELKKISTRTMNALEGAGIKSIGGLIKKTEKDLEDLEGLGARGVEEIKKSLKKIGVSLKQI